MEKLTVTATGRHHNFKPGEQVDIVRVAGSHSREINGKPSKTHERKDGIWCRKRLGKNYSNLQLVQWAQMDSVTRNKYQPQ